VTVIERFRFLHRAILSDLAHNLTVPKIGFDCVQGWYFDALGNANQRSFPRPPSGPR